MPGYVGGPNTIVVGWAKCIDDAGSIYATDFLLFLTVLINI